MTETLAQPIRDARIAGEDAARAGRRLRDNPHAGDDTPKSRVLARMWDVGFTSADPITVDYT